jgi:hypothetical protein
MATMRSFHLILPTADALMLPDRVLRAITRSVIGRLGCGDGKRDIGLRLTNLRRNGVRDV